MSETELKILGDIERNRYGEWFFSPTTSAADIPEQEAWAVCSLTAAQEAIARLEAERDALKMSRDDWIRENGRGGFIDNLRNAELARRIERDTARAELAELRKTLEAVQTNARRYEWLRNDMATEWGEPWAITRYAPGDVRNSDGGTCPLIGAELDAAIDACHAAIDAADAASGKGSQDEA